MNFTLHRIKHIFWLAALFLALAGCSSDKDAKKWWRPTANAGSDQVYQLPLTQIPLLGSAKSHIKVYDIDKIRWSMSSGPQPVTILNSDKLEATVINPVAGTYTFKLEVTDDGNRKHSDTVTIIVKPAATAQSKARAVATFRTSLDDGYQHNFDVVWHAINDFYIDLPDVEQQWHSLYQEYAEQAAASESDQQWRDTVQAMLAELGDPDLALYQDAIRGKAVSGLNWYIDDFNQGWINVGALDSLTAEQMETQLNQAIEALHDTTQIWLNFANANHRDVTGTLRLMQHLNLQEGLTLCVISSQEETCDLEMGSQPDADLPPIEVLADGSQTAQYVQYLLGNASHTNNPVLGTEFIPI